MGIQENEMHTNRVFELEANGSELAMMDASFSPLQLPRSAYQSGNIFLSEGLGPRYIACAMT
jgi:hypothetical protein